MTTGRGSSTIDRLVAALDDGLRTVFAPAPRPQRPSPAAAIPETALDADGRLLCGRLMRVNHTGEVCAQALYRGGALTARAPHVRATMLQAAAEENDHLAWTEECIRDLGSRASLLNPLWYAGAFVIGAMAGIAGDKWSLGFVAETEHQVVAHLDGHLQQLPAADHRSRVVLEEMCADEGRHATVALEAGAAPLPGLAKRVMRFASGIMTRTAYWL